MTDIPGTHTPIKVVAHGSHDVRVDVGPYTFSPAEARELAATLMAAAMHAGRVPDIHERHVNLLASCPLCRFEAGAQIDRLEYDEEDEES